MQNNLSHLNRQGEVHMVDVGERPVTRREAEACGVLRMERSTLEMIQRGEAPKGDLLAVARVAAIQAAKRTWELVPLCHPLPLSGVKVTIDPNDALPGLTLHCCCRTTGQTGGEMEAMTWIWIWRRDRDILSGDEKNNTNRDPPQQIPVKFKTLLFRIV